MRGTGGFTLVELLVAMTAGSLLLVGLGWTVGSLARELGSAKQNETLHQVAAVTPTLTGLIEGALPAMSTGPSIVIDSDRLEFMTVPPRALGAVGPVRLALWVGRDKGLAALHASFEPAEPSGVIPQAAGAETVLVGGLDDIRFEYSRPDGGDGDLAPRLITIYFEDSEGRVIRVSAAPRINSSGDCRFDPISMTCRR